VTVTDDVIARTRHLTARRLTAVGAVIAALMLTAAVAIFISRGRSTPARPAPPVPQLAPSAAGDAAASEPLGVLRWALVAGIAIPTSTRCGPFDTSAGLARGFSHDRGGAVLAAVHVVVRVAPQVGADIFNPTLGTQVTGPDAEALRSRVAQEYEDLRELSSVRYGQPVGDLQATLRGYRIHAYTSTEATVELLTASNGDTGRVIFAASTVRMSWTGSDWVLIAPAGGSFDSVVSTAVDASGFDPFPGRR